MSTNNRRIDPAIIAALIGVLGTVCVTVISLFANNLIPRTQTPQPTLPPTVGIGEPTQPAPTPAAAEPTWTITPTVTLTNTAVPTDTVAVGEASSTPAPDTPTPEATFTAAPPAIGSDWANGCISILWRPYPETIPTSQDTTGCYIEPVAEFFFADDDNLRFLAAGRFDDTQVRGMFAPLPASGTVNINAYLKSLQDGEVWMGVFAEPNLESQGMIIVIPPGDVRRRVLVQKTMPGQVEVQTTASFSRNPAIYDVVFEFGNGAVTTRILNDTVFNPIPVGTGQQWLFVGFQVKRGNNRIDAEFLNLRVQGQ